MCISGYINCPIPGLTDKARMISRSPDGKRLCTNQRFCCHCNNLLSYKTYQAHKWLYYDDSKDCWYWGFWDEEVKCAVQEEALPSEHNFECESARSSPPLSPTNSCVGDNMGWPKDMRECEDSWENHSPPHSEAGFYDTDSKLYTG